ncbi:indole-3-pyruvate monooxygenase [Trifolium repens]|nr:indole-3-pyruvate monooxygenase [Trifolium repens]
METEMPVVIVGAGPAGLAISACLNKFSIPNIVLRKDDWHASLWRKRAYDRLKLHLAKEFCNLPHMPFSSDLPKFAPRVDFLRYLDEYVINFKISIWYNRYVNDASFYIADHLVVAIGENCDAYVPMINGLESFEGEYLHCNKYLNGRSWYDKNVLVVGSGNSGMEIGYDLTTWGANTSIVIRSLVSTISLSSIYFFLSN